MSFHSCWMTCGHGITRIGGLSRDWATVQLVFPKLRLRVVLPGSLEPEHQPCSPSRNSFNVALSCSVSVLVKRTCKKPIYCQTVSSDCAKPPQHLPVFSDSLVLGLLSSPAFQYCVRRSERISLRTCQVCMVQPSPSPYSIHTILTGSRCLVLASFPLTAFQVLSNWPNQPRVWSFTTIEHCQRLGLARSMAPRFVWPVVFLAFSSPLQHAGSVTKKELRLATTKV